MTNSDYLDRRLRHAVTLEATVNTGEGEPRSAEVANFSLEGCCVSGFYPIGSLVDLKIKPLGMFRAQVRWAFAGRAGLRFVKESQPPRSIAADNRGVAAIEYCIAAALIALAITVALTGLGGAVESNFNNVDGAVGGGTNYNSG